MLCSLEFLDLEAWWQGLLQLVCLAAGGMSLSHCRFPFPVSIRVLRAAFS